MTYQVALVAVLIYKKLGSWYDDEVWSTSIMHDKKLTKDQVKHIARLAWIGLSEDEIEVFQDQLSSILQYVDQLNELDTKNVIPTYQVTGLKNVWREDKIKLSFSQQEALQNAPQFQDGYFKVKKVM